MISVIYLSFVFAASEIILAIVRHSRRGNSKIRGDKGSLIIMWLAITLGFTCGFILSKPLIPFWSGFGFSFLVFGLIIRWLSILQLGKSFTVNVAITDSSILKTDGIYERIRHPSYSGLLAGIAGFAFTMSSVFSFIALVIPVFLSILYRIQIEEKLLINEFGSAYLDYKSKTKRLIPGIY
jgi:protein-S-isoprenylcysteine O-methyltransferase Ste14